MNEAEIEDIIKSGGYLTPKQASIYLGLTVKALADYRSRKRKPEYIKRLNAIRYPSNAIIEFIIHRNQIKMMPEYDHLLLTTLEHDT